MRYVSHSLMDYVTENGQNAMKVFHSKILEYVQKFFGTNESDELSVEL